MHDEDIRLILFHPYSEYEGRPDYEIRVDATDAIYVPREIREGSKGEIRDAGSSRRWESLPEMTHDLRFEILEWRLACLN